MISDLHTAWRSLRRARGFAAITILTLALGIGSATAIFSVVDWVLFRSVDFPADLCMVGRDAGSDRVTPALPGVVAEDYARRETLFERTGLAATQIGNVVLDDQPVAFARVGVTEDLLSMFRVTLSMGRSFRPEEYVPGYNNVVIVTHDFWQNKLGGDPNVLGRILHVEETPCTVIGVMRQHQTLPTQLNMGVLQPHRLVADPASPWSPAYFFFAQLRPGQTAESVRAALVATPPELPAKLAERLLKDPPAVQHLNAVSSWLRPEYYRMLLGAVAFLYAIACLNAINLIVVRRLGQARELAIRLALGAGRWRVMRLSLAESLWLVGLGGAAALLVANTLLPLLWSMADTAHLRTDSSLWRLDGRAVAILIGLSVITMAMITLVPLLRLWRASPQTHLKDGPGALGDSRGLARLRGGLVVLQIAAALVLLTGAGLMVRTFERLQAVDPGFAIENRWKVTLTLPIGQPLPFEAYAPKWEALQSELKQLPGVQSVSYGSDIVLPGFTQADKTIEGASGEPLTVAVHFMDTDFPATAGLRLVRGRGLDPLHPKTEVLINESLAQLRWPGQDPVGQLLIPGKGNILDPGDRDGLQVVGVLRDVQVTPRLRPPPAFFRNVSSGAFAARSVILHTVANVPDAFGDAIRRQLYQWDPGVVVFTASALSELRHLHLRVENLARSALQVLAVLAVVLTAVGVFALLAFTVDLRRGEFGVRLALGATRRHLVRLVLGHGFRLALIGTLVGLGSAWALGRYLESLMFETSPHDPVVLASVGLMLMAIALAACVVPAIRATRINIARLLRSE